MATPIVSESGRQASEDESLFRALNPKHMEDGLPSERNFPMSRKQDPPGDGVSVGVSSRVSLSELRSIPALRERCGNQFAVAELPASHALEPVRALGISVTLKHATEWGAFGHAHAVITGYRTWKDIDGKRWLHEFQRHLTKLARKRFYPQAADTPIEV